MFPTICNGAQYSEHPRGAGAARLCLARRSNDTQWGRYWPPEDAVLAWRKLCIARPFFPPVLTKVLAVLPESGDARRAAPNIVGKVDMQK